MSEALLLSLKQTYNNNLLYDETLYEFRSRNRLWNTPNLGLLTVGAMLRQKYEIEYIDQNYEDIKRWNYDFVFMSPTTAQADEAYRLSKAFREHGTKVVLGGPHVTMLPQEAIQYVDHVFVGESEDTAAAFLSGDRKKFYIADHKPDLQKSPVPLYFLSKKYPYSSIPVQLSRGCPHQCGFCLSSTIYGKKIRRKSLAKAESELRHIKLLYDKPFIFFTDDNFFADTGFAFELLTLLETLKIEWYAFTDISVYQKTELLQRLYRSGCRKLLIGFESLNHKNLRAVNRSGFKESRIDAYRRAVDAIQQERIGIVGSFVLGLEYDDDDTFDELYNFILETSLYGTNITVATPFPGTRFYREISARQTLSEKWSMYDGFTLVYDIPGISREVFMQRYLALIQRVNSKERLNRMVKYFKELL